MGEGSAVDAGAALVVVLVVAAAIGIGYAVSTQATSYDDSEYSSLDGVDDVGELTSNAAHSKLDAGDGEDGLPSLSVSASKKSGFFGIKWLF